MAFKKETLTDLGYIFPEFNFPFLIFDRPNLNQHFQNNHFNRLKPHLSIHESPTSEAWLKHEYETPFVLILGDRNDSNLITAIEFAKSNNIITIFFDFTSGHNHGFADIMAPLESIHRIDPVVHTLIDLHICEENLAGLDMADLSAVLSRGGYLYCFYEKLDQMTIINAADKTIRMVSANLLSKTKTIIASCVSNQETGAKTSLAEFDTAFSLIRQNSPIGINYICSLPIMDKKSYFSVLYLASEPLK